MGHPAKLDRILVYSWRAWDGFLVSHLVADHCRVEASYGDSPTEILRFVSPNILAVLPQINLSDSGIFPRAREELFQALRSLGVLLLNTEVEDIRKSSLHGLLAEAGLPSAKAERNGPPEELLFVKSNLNWGGGIELSLPSDMQKTLKLEPRPAIDRWDRYYTVRRGDAPDALWEDASVVVETYFRNPENSFHRVYGFGDSLVVVKAHHEALVQKLNGHPLDRNHLISRGDLMRGGTDIPDCLRDAIARFITRHPLAFFCLDIVHDSRGYRIVDLNLTPWAGFSAQSEASIEFLIQGAQSWLLQRPATVQA